MSRSVSFCFIDIFTLSKQGLRRFDQMLVDLRDARANALTAFGIYQRKASKTTESPFLRKADEESLSANVASYRIGCSGNLNEKNDT